MGTTEHREESQEEEQLPVQPLNFYLKSENTFKIISTRWGLFTALSGVIYVYHLIATIAGVNVYTDVSRLTPCAGKEGDEASKVLDLAIALTTIFHMIEWVRQTIFLTSALVNVNIVGIFYALSLNIPFGFIVMLVAIITRYTEDASACAEEGLQDTRAAYLSL